MQTGVVSTLDAVEKLQDAIYSTIPSGGRFSVDGTTIAIEQSAGGAALSIDASHCLQCTQSAANPVPSTGIPTGVFSVPEIDWELKNAGRIDLTSTNPADYYNTTLTIGSNVYEFVNTSAGAPFNAVTDAGNVAIDLASCVSGGVLNLVSAVSQISSALTANATDSSRFVASGTSLEIYQSETGESIMLSTGNVDRFTFNGANAASYVGQTINVDGQTYTFTNGAGGTYDVDISAAISGTNTADDVVNYLRSKLQTLYDAGTISNTPDRLTVKGNTLIAADGIVTAGSAAAVETTSVGIGNILSGMVRGQNTPGTVGTSLTASPVVIGDSFTFNGVLESEDGTVAAAVRFNSDGTPKYFNVSNISIEWANGAEDMTGAGDEGSKIDVFLGNTDTNDGLTTLSGDFSTNYIKQDGAKFGNFAGVTIGEDGIVTALFDNGETRPIGMIPVATFVNANGLQALTGNTWIETDYSGQPVLREASSGGAGSIQAGTLEASTVDIATEFTSMITTQRAYSAASKIITTADEMLDELINIKR